MTDYYTCPSCSGYRVSCGCAAKEAIKRRAYWAEKATEYRKAAQTVQCLIDNCDEEDSDGEALRLILRLAEPAVLQAEKFSEDR